MYPVVELIDSLIRKERAKGRMNIDLGLEKAFPYCIYEGDRASRSPFVGPMGVQEAIAGRRRSDGAVKSAQ